MTQRKKLRLATASDAKRDLSCMVFAVNENAAELVFVADNAHDAEMFARGLTAAQYIQDAEVCRIFTGDRLPHGELPQGDFYTPNWKRGEAS